MCLTKSFKPIQRIIVYESTGYLVPEPLLDEMVESIRSNGQLCEVIEEPLGKQTITWIFMKLIRKILNTMPITLQVHHTRNIIWKVTTTFHNIQSTNSAKGWDWLWKMDWTNFMRRLRLEMTRERNDMRERNLRQWLSSRFSSLSRCAITIYYLHLWFSSRKLLVFAFAVTCLGSWGHFCEFGVSVTNQINWIFLVLKKLVHKEWDSYSCCSMRWSTVKRVVTK